MCSDVLLLTSGLRSYCVQLLVDCVFVHKILLQQLRLQQSNFAFLEVDDNGAGDVLTFIGAHRHHRRQTPLQFTQNIVNSNTIADMFKRVILLLVLLT